jgi:hypothetical protein
MLFLRREEGDVGVEGVVVPLVAAVQLLSVSIMVETMGDSLPLIVVVVLELNAFQKVSLFPLGLQEEEEDLLGLTTRESLPSKLGEEVDLPRLNCCWTDRYFFEFLCDPLSKLAVGLIPSLILRCLLLFLLNGNMFCMCGCIKYGARGDTFFGSFMSLSLFLLLLLLLLLSLPLCSSAWLTIVVTKSMLLKLLPYGKYGRGGCCCSCVVCSG